MSQWPHTPHKPLPFIVFQCINEEGFRLFLKTYLEVEDFPLDLCQRLFRSFQNSEAAEEEIASEITYHVLTQLSASSLLCSRPSSVSSITCLTYTDLSLLTRYGKLPSLSSISPVEEVFLKDVSCYFSLLEDGQPRDKLECKCCFLPAKIS